LIPKLYPMRPTEKSRRVFSPAQRPAKPGQSRNAPASGNHPDAQEFQSRTDCLLGYVEQTVLRESFQAFNRLSA